MHLICFEDSGVEQLAPATTSRPAFAISCGGFRLLDWIEDLRRGFGKSIHVAVRPFLRTICESDHGVKCIDAKTCDLVRGDDVLLINACLSPTVAARTGLMLIAKHPGSIASRDSQGRVIFAKLSASQWEQFSEASAKCGSMVRTLETLVETFVETVHHEFSEPTASQMELYQWPHDIVRIHVATMVDAMSYRIGLGDLNEIQTDVFVGRDVQIGGHCVFDTSTGPIVLGDRVKVGPFSYFAGPIYVSPDVRVIEHSSIKDAVAIGHTCKVGGEVEASILEPYTNKQHHGFLGHSYLGSWINLGAGTCNSDLKNTYGKINVTYGDQKVATDMQFFGCVMGDYSKTAINTSIFTGKNIGVCSMMYGFVTGNVPSYVNYAKLFGQTSIVPPEVMLSTQKRMFARRKIEQRSCDQQLIRDMFTLTSGERGADPDLL